MKLSRPQQLALADLVGSPRPDLQPKGGPSLRSLRALVAAGLAEEEADIPFEDGTVLDVGFVLTMAGVKLLLAADLITADAILDGENVVGALRELVAGAADEASVPPAPVEDDSVDEDEVAFPALAMGQRTPDVDLASIASAVTAAEGLRVPLGVASTAPKPVYAPRGGARQSVLGASKTSILILMGGAGASPEAAGAVLAYFGLTAGHQSVACYVSRGRLLARRGWPDGKPVAADGAVELCSAVATAMIAGKPIPVEVDERILALEARLAAETSTKVAPKAKRFTAEDAEAILGFVGRATVRDLTGPVRDACDKLAMMADSAARTA